MWEIVPLPKERYEGYTIPFEYDTRAYYDVRLSRMEHGFSVDFVRTELSESIAKHFEDTLYEDWADAPEAHGILEGERLVAVLEVSPENWNNRLRVLNIWVDRDYRRHGLGRLLMDHAKAIARAQHRRAVILETQSCNEPAIAFYLAQGFQVAGFDACAYSNDDVAKGEVRLEMAYIERKENDDVHGPTV